MEPDSKRSKQNSETSPVNVKNPSDTCKPVVTISSLPLEVLEYILEVDVVCKAIKIKTWRLVSKSWNEICCRILRKVSEVPLHPSAENNDDDCKNLEDFKDLIIDRQADFSSDWPNPFQNFKILEVSLVSKSLARFVRRPNVKITTFEILHNEGFNSVGFESILEQIRGELIHLKISGKSESAPFLTPTEKLGYQGWKLLQSITLRDTCKGSSKPCLHTQFIIGLKNELQLKKIDLNGDLRNIARIFEKEDRCWGTLVHLELECGSPPSDVTPEQINQLMKWTEEISLGPLTHLSMWFTFDNDPKQTLEQYTPYLVPLIQKCSLQVEELLLNCIPFGVIPSLQNLKNLSCAMMDGDRIQDVTELRFPALTSALFKLYWTEVPTYANPKDVESNKNLRNLITLWSPTVPHEVTQELLWSILKVHFPNLHYLSIEKNVTSATLHAIKKRLPKLQEIQLKKVTSFELLGTNSGPAFTAKGWPCEIFENCALLEMTELTHVTLGKYATVSKDVISACLGKLPKIKLLLFYWNSSLQTSDIPEHLGHIQDVTIVCADNAQRAELEKLTKTMKSLKVRKHP